MERRNLKILRVKHGLTQMEMSKKIGVSLSIYCKVENGKQNCSTRFLRKLQQAFNIPDSEIWEYKKTFDESEE